MPVRRRQQTDNEPEEKQPVADAGFGFRWRRVRLARELGCPSRRLRPAASILLQDSSSLSPAAPLPLLPTWNSF